MVGDNHGPWTVSVNVGGSCSAKVISYKPVKPEFILDRRIAGEFAFSICSISQAIYNLVDKASKCRCYLPKAVS